MEQPKIQSTDKVLSKLKNSVGISEQELEEIFSRIDQPLLEFDKNGEVEREFDSKKLSVRYRELNPEEHQKMLDASIQAGLGNAVNYDDWRVITKLQLLDQEGLVLDFMTSSPEGYELFFNSSSYMDWGFVRSKEGRAVGEVYVIGNFSFKALLTTLHEIGHLWDYSRLQTLDKDHLMDDHRHAMRAEVLRRERAASAFAFAKLRKLTQDDSLRKDAVSYLKYFALKDYYDRAAKEIQHDEYMSDVVAKDFDQGSLDVEEAERQFYDDFLKWKKSSMYEMWKSHREPMEDWEEYGKWREWLTESGYDYYKDIE